MYGNNEVGTIQPIREIGEFLKDHQATFHTDAVQAYGIENIDVNRVEVDLLAFLPIKLMVQKELVFYMQDKV